MKGNYVSLAEETAKKISEMILQERKYLPGDRLPNEFNLSKELGVSRSSIREAVKILIANNVLYIIRGVGTFVTDTSQEINPFDIFYSKSKKHLVTNAFELRLIIETETTRMAVENATPIDIKNIKLAEEECARLIDAEKNFSVADQQFHSALAKAAHNDLLVQLIPSLHVSIAAIIQAYSFRDDIRKLLSENAKFSHKKL